MPRTLRTVRSRCARAIAVLIPLVLAAQDAALHISVVSGEGAAYSAGAHAAKPLTIEVTDAAGRPVAGARVSFQAPVEGPGGVFASGLQTDLATTDSSGRATLRSLQLNRVPGAFHIRITAAKEQARAGTVVKQFIGDANAPLQSADRRSPQTALQTAPPTAAPSQPPAAEPLPAPPRQTVPTRTEPAKVAAIAVPRPGAGVAAIAGIGQSGAERVPTIIITQKNSKSGAEVGARSGHGSHRKWILLGILVAGGAAGAFAATSMASAASHGAANPGIAGGLSAAITIGTPTISLGKP